MSMSLNNFLENVIISRHNLPPDLRNLLINTKNRIMNKDIINIMRTIDTTSVNNESFRGAPMTELTQYLGITRELPEPLQKGTMPQLRSQLPPPQENERRGGKKKTRKGRKTKHRKTKHRKTKKRQRK